MNIQASGVIALLCALGLSVTPLPAVPSGERVIENTNDVFTRPEFSRLRKATRSELVREDLPWTNPGQGRGDGDGQPEADGRGDGRGQNDPGNGPGDGNHNPHRQRNLRDENPPNANQDRSSFRSSPSAGSFGSGMAGLFRFLGFLALAIMVGIIVLMVVKAIQDRDSRLDQELTGTLQSDVGELETDHPASELPSDEYLRRAEQYARSGAFREAVACVLLGAMSELEHRGLVRYRKGLTQRDYYRTVRQHPSLGPAYRALLKLYEPLGFGRRSAELRHYQLAVKSFQGGFRDRTAISEV